MSHPGEQVELRIYNADVDIQLDNYHHGLIRLGIFEDGPRAEAAIGKLTWRQALQLGQHLVRKAEWLRRCEANQQCGTEIAI